MEKSPGTWSEMRWFEKSPLGVLAYDPWPTLCSHEPFQRRGLVGCVVHCLGVPDTAAKPKTSVSGAVEENKEQKGKRKYHAGTPHPNDRGGFTQWFGSCSLITTLYVWFPACWAPMVAERLFSWSPPPMGSSYSQHGRSDSGPPHKYFRSASLAPK